MPPEFDRIVARALAKDRAARYRDAAELRTDLKRLAMGAQAGAEAPALHAPRSAATESRPRSGGTSVPAPREQSRRRWAWITAPLAAVAVAAGVFVYRSVATPALTAQDAVVLSAIVNRTGDAMFDDTLAEAVALQIRQSPVLKVASEARVQGTLRLMGRDPTTIVTAEVGREVCQRLGARALSAAASPRWGRPTC